MKKEKVVMMFFRYDGKPVQAKREVSFELRLEARMILDEICFLYNKCRLEESLNKALENRDKYAFIEHSEALKEFIWE